MRLADLKNSKDWFAMQRAQSRTDSHNVRSTYFAAFTKENDSMSIKEKLAAKAAALKSGKKNGAAKTTTKKSAKNGKEKVATPRAESKTATILALLKSGKSREFIRSKYDMEKLSDVGWYISKFKAKGLLAKSFERE